MRAAVIQARVYSVHLASPGAANIHFANLYAPNDPNNTPPTLSTPYSATMSDVQQRKVRHQSEDRCALASSKHDITPIFAACRGARQQPPGVRARACCACVAISLL